MKCVTVSLCRLLCSLDSWQLPVNCLWCTVITDVM